MSAPPYYYNNQPYNPYYGSTPAIPVIPQPGYPPASIPAVPIVPAVPIQPVSIPAQPIVVAPPVAQSIIVHHRRPGLLGALLGAGSHHHHGHHHHHFGHGHRHGHHHTRHY